MDLRARCLIFCIGFSKCKKVNMQKSRVQIQAGEAVSRSAAGLLKQFIDEFIVSFVFLSE